MDCGVGINFMELPIVSTNCIYNREFQKVYMASHSPLRRLCPHQDHKRRGGQSPRGQALLILKTTPGREAHGQLGSRDARRREPPGEDAPAEERTLQGALTMDAPAAEAGGLA